MIPASTLESARIRADFPILQEQVNGRELVYLDSASTSQKPEVVIDAVSDYYRHANANVHRGVHVLGERATEVFEGAREAVAHLVGADPRGVVFVRNTTEGINLVAQAFARERFGPLDRIVCTEMEHHSNLVPWQQVRDQTGCQLEFIPLQPDGRLDPEATERLLRAPTRLLAVTHVSNVLGTINPVGELITRAHAEGITVLVDGAQAVPHMPVDLQRLDADFYAFSAHKMCGPTGIGVLYGRPELLDAMPPFLTGGSMISVVTLEKTTWDEIPAQVRGGNPGHRWRGRATGGRRLSAAGGIAGDPSPRRRTHRVCRRDALRGTGTDPLRAQGSGPDGNRLLQPCRSTPSRRGHDRRPLRSRDPGRAPLLPAPDAKAWVAATTRASFYLYNTRDDVDALVAALGEANRIFAD